MNTQFDKKNTILHFKTNINCSGCIDKISPFLNAEKGISHWNVDTSIKEKRLTITTTITKNEIIETVQKAGFKCENID
jgi:copper chaperone